MARLAQQSAEEINGPAVDAGLLMRMNDDQA